MKKSTILQITLVLLRMSLFFAFLVSSIDGLHAQDFKPTGIQNKSVVLVDYSAKSCSEGVKIAWSTATQVNCDYFVIEKGSDGSSWTECGIAKGAINSSTVLNYALCDAEINYSTVYYRLTVVCLDGTKTVLKAISFTPESRSKSIAFPNPCSSILHFVDENPDENMVSLIDGSGNEILVQKISSDSSLSRLDLSQMRAGIYVLKVGDKRITVLKE